MLVDINSPHGHFKNGATSYFFASFDSFVKSIILLPLRL